MNEPKPQPRDIMSEKTLGERLQAASWDEALRADANRALESGAPSYIIEEIEAVARLCGEAATALTQAQADLGLERESHEVTKRMLDDADRELTEGRARCAEVEKLLRRAIDDLIWCGGSADFGPEGQAKIGYDKGPRATIAAIDAALKAQR